MLPSETYRSNSSVRHKSRRGTVLVAVLVCIGIALAITLVALRSSLSTRRQLVLERQVEQTRWLLDAGITRAIRSVSSNKDFEREIWLVEPMLADYRRAEVEAIVLQRNNNQVRVRVTATTVGVDPVAKPVQRSKIFTIDEKEEP